MSKCDRTNLRSVGVQLQQWHVDENGNEESPVEEGDYEHDHYECATCNRMFDTYEGAKAHYAA